MTDSSRPGPRTTQDVRRRQGTAIKLFLRATLKSVLLLGLSMTTATALAQFTAGVQGSVQDSAGASVPNATITLTNDDNQVSQTTTTDSGGVFRFASLGPGSYTIAAAAPGFSQAKTQFSRLVDAAAGGEEIVIAKAGKPAARLVPMERVKVARRFGGLKGKVRIAEDFDAPLPDDVIAAFEGR